MLIMECSLPQDDGHLLRGPTPLLVLAILWQPCVPCDLCPVISRLLHPDSAWGFGGVPVMVLICLQSREEPQGKGWRRRSEHCHNLRLTDSCLGQELRGLSYECCVYKNTSDTLRQLPIAAFELNALLIDHRRRCCVLAWSGP